MAQNNGENEPLGVAGTRERIVRIACVAFFDEQWKRITRSVHISSLSGADINSESNESRGTLFAASFRQRLSVFPF